MVRVLRHCPARLKKENNLNDYTDGDVQVVKGNIGDEMTKEGECLFELRRANITQWGFSRPEMYIGQSKENALNLENGLYVSRETSFETQPVPKKRRLSICDTICDIGWAEAVSCEKKGQYSHKVRAQSSKVERWSAERYTLAQQSMLDILKAKGAVFGKAITRHDLRAAAREHIGDTGLLDHLLKQVDGRVAPGGTERFRRCYNTNGVMEYWLESADLDEIRQKAGVSDPYWIPPSKCKPGNALQFETAPAKDIKLLKMEMDKFKCDVMGIVTKDLETVKDTVKEELRNELVKQTGIIRRSLFEIRSSVSNVQEMSKDLMSWKYKAEQKITELSNAVSSLQSTRKGSSTLGPPDRWDDLLGVANLDSMQGEDFAPWWENNGMLRVREETMLSTKFSLPEAELKTENTAYRELNVLKDDVANIRREMKELVPKKQDEDQSNGTLDSVISAHSKLDVDNTLVMFKETLTEFEMWKVKVEKKVNDLTNTVAGIVQRDSTF